jgi:hypothetical protein
MSRTEMKTLTPGELIILTADQTPATVDQVGDRGVWLRLPDGTAPFYRWADAQKIRRPKEEEHAEKV